MKGWSFGLGEAWRSERIWGTQWPSIALSKWANHSKFTILIPPWKSGMANLLAKRNSFFHQRTTNSFVKHRPSRCSLYYVFSFPYATILLLRFPHWTEVEDVMPEMAHERSMRPQLLCLEKMRFWPFVAAKNTDSLGAVTLKFALGV